MPIFPWLPPDWGDQGAHARDQPRKTLVLTKDYISDLPKNKTHLRSVGAAGAETLVVVAHVTPLDRKKLQGYFNQAVKGRSRSPIGNHFKDRLETMDIQRRTCEVAGMGLTSGPSSDALARLKERLEHLPMRVDACKALVIPTLGGE